ncbi:MAG: tetratricopeptide repeat protein [Isosphaeraceae bacterium]
MNEESIFAAALARATTEERRAFLDEVCAGDPAMRQRLDLLLAAHDQTLGILDQPSPPAGWPGSMTGTAPGDPGRDEAEDRVVGGRFRLIERIGEGGMGSVWKAEQTEPVRRTVALKLIRSGLDTRAVLSRFDTERQALAMMEHPNIARVLDGGTTESGRPYFVMEYVKGIPITRYCDEARLTIAERLELFLPVCLAVQHAHTKGIIHRDLKPSNILVCLYDGKPVPKVIDFGLAKATHGPLADEALTTAHGVVLGTPLYMSPEQAQFNNLDVDTRTDIYALGVILYELLTGSTPLEARRFREAAWHEVLRVIKEEDPPRPSTRLSESGALPNVAAQRDVEPARLTRLVRGDLDWIAMRCLEKERGRRYPTADQLARDIQNYLRDEPVEASPPTTSYRLRKFLRKHRRSLLAASLVLLALVAGLLGTAWGLVRAEHALAAERLRAEREQRANEQATMRLKQVERGIELLTSVFYDLDPRSEPKEGRPLRAILADRLALAARELEGEKVAEPLDVANLQNRLGQSLIGLGFPREAVPLFEKARDTRTRILGADDPDTLGILNNLARSYQEDGKLAEARDLFEPTLEKMKTRLGPDHPDTLMLMNNLASVLADLGDRARAAVLYNDALAGRTKVLGPEHRDTLASMNNLACLYVDEFKTDLAIPLHQKTLAIRKAKLGADHDETLDSTNNLAEAYRAAGQVDKALPLWEDTLRRRKAHFPLDHPDTLAVMNNVATGYQSLGRLDESIPILEDTLRLSRAKFGADHPATIRAMNNLADAYTRAGKGDRALPLSEEAFALIKQRLGPTHPDSLTVMQNLAEGYRRAGKLELARPLLEECVRLRRIHSSADQPEALMAISNLASLYRASGEVDRAIPLWEEVARRMKTKVGPDHPFTLTTLNNLASGYRAAKRYNDAVAIFEEIAKSVEQKEFQHEFASRFLDNLIRSQTQLGRLDEAESWRRKAIDLAKRKSGEESKAYAYEQTMLGELQLAQKKWDTAEATLRQAQSLWDRVDPDGWMRQNTRSDLGAALLERKQFNDAESLLKPAYDALKRLESKIPPIDRPCLTECVQRLVKLYEAWGRPESAAEWRAKLPVVEKSPR